MFEEEKKKIEEDGLYTRHKGIEMKIPQEIFVVGCGGTGTWISILGAMMGVKIIHISDHDVLENHKRSRLPYKERDIGKLKTEALKEFITLIRPDCTIYTYEGIHTDSDLFTLTGEVIFDCNDNPEIQDMIYKYCKNEKLKYVGAGCNANHVSIIDNLDFVCGREYSPYEITPMFIIPAISSAACAWWNVVKQIDRIYVLKNLSDMYKGT